MSNSAVRSAVSLLFCLVPLAGCEFHDYDDCDDDYFCDEDQDWDERHRDKPDRTRVNRDCSEACDRLVGCGRVDGPARAECVSACVEAHAKGDYGTRLFFRCAEQTSCRELIDECGPVPPTVVPGNRPPPNADASAPPTAPEAPPMTSPTPDATPDAPPRADASVPGEGDAGADAGAAACECQTHADCATVEACVEGICRARCEVACDCRAGDVCSAGVCMPSATPNLCPLSAQ